MSAKFRCAECGQLFDDEPDEEQAATEELAHNFPGFDKSDCDRLCDECFNRFMAWYKSGGKSELDANLSA